MLQRAASNAYSWWWAGHIRTKQSKWLEQNLQDMEEKVEIMLKLIQEDGDSFAKRAEMYYKKRPELINFVEESYRAYRSLAERYDHISTELQNANNTIASVFPEQVQFMDEDDEDGTPNVQKKFPEGSRVNIPKVPKLPSRDLKGLLTMATKKLQPKKASKSATTHSVAKSGLSKPEAIAEIDKLQKGILALQTEKEFVKSSYENGLAKYWEIEKQINETQEKICHLQDEFSVGAVIEDDEARNLMAVSALKSCQETLTQLQEKQEKSNEEARVEQQRIKDARVKLDSLKDELLPDQEKPHDKDKTVNAEEKSKKLEQEVDTVTQERQDLELLREKIKEQFEAGSNSSLTVNEMAEQIDRLVNKVISLETAVSSQSALINRLRTETDELQAQIRCLEDDKGAKDDLSNKLKEMEEKLQEVQVLNQNVEDQNNNLQTHFTEAHCNLDHLSEKLHTVKPDEELEAVISSQKEEKPPVEVKSKKDDKSKVEVKSQKESKELGEVKTKVEEGIKKQDRGGEEEKVSQSAENNGLDNVSQKSEDRKQKDEADKKDSFSQSGTDDGPDNASQTSHDLKQKDEADKKDSFSQSGTDDGPDNASQTSHDLKLRDEADKKESSQASDNLLNAEPRKQEDEPNWQQLFKDVKKKLSEAEKQQDMKDEEIRSLRQKLSLLQGTDENKDSKESKTLDKQTTSKVRTEESSALKTSKPQPTEKGKDEEEEDDIKVIVIDQPRAISPTEEKFRTKIDELLEQNLDFWLRFSTSFHQIQKFQTEVKDLQAEIQKVKEKVDKKQEDKKQEGSTSATTGTSTADPSLKSDARPIYRHLREIQTELGMWVEQSVLLKDELQSRFSSLCSIQEEISKASKSPGSDKEEAEFSSYEAAKFQGEVLNMKQENNKVAEELQAGLDHITGLQLEIEKTLATLNEEFGLSGSKNNIQLQHSTSKTRVPLQSFIFGTKPKKQRPSIFPALHWKYSHLKTGRPL